MAKVKEPNSRAFGDRWYVRFHTFGSKPEAQSKASHIRNTGWPARVTTRKAGRKIMYDVWTAS